MTDGTLKEGVAKYPGKFDAKNIEFRQDRNSRTERIKSNDIRSIRYLRNDGNWVEFDRYPMVSFNNPNQSKKSVFKNVSMRGPVTLYKNITRTSHTTETTHIYLRKENENFVSHLPVSSVLYLGMNFRQIAADYFADSPVISRKIRDGEKGYGRWDIEDIVHEYNAEKIAQQQ
jgi:hypothetical protein